MKTSRAWTTYILVRVLAFIVPFGIIMLVLPGWQWNWLVGVVVGAIVSLTISQIFLYRERFAVADSLKERVEAKEARRDERRPIDIEEDADLDAQSSDASEDAATDATDTSADDASDASDDAK